MKKSKAVIILLISILLAFTCGCTKSVTANNSYSVTVYITKTGDCYHSKNCSYLRKSKISISLDNAIAQGYDRCSKCNPPKVSSGK